MQYPQTSDEMMLKSEPNYQVLSQTLDGPNLRVRRYQKRKSHAKTRSGCLFCKAKKVKCDEGRPICERCKRNGRQCSYNVAMSRALPQEPPSHLGLISSLSAVTISTGSPRHYGMKGTSNLELIQHLLAHWTTIFHIPCDTRLLSMSQSNPLVESTMLAIAACHLRHVAPNVTQYQFAEFFYQTQVVSGIRGLLNRPVTSFVQSDADGLLLCATLLNIITFALPRSRETNKAKSSVSWVLESNNDGRAWLDLQVALRPLLLHMPAFLEDTINFLAPIFFGGEKHTWEFQKMSEAANAIPPNWAKFFELNYLYMKDSSKSNGRGKVFEKPVTMLIQLRDLDPVAFNIYKSIQFLAKIQQAFRYLLLERDSKALWLLGYWFGLLCRFGDIWWSEQRSKRDHHAVCVLLRQRRHGEEPGEEGILWAEMMLELEMVTTQ
ncbi:unnamed protein product [Periconia digitata]|uniref:Zn(2)-C6 fungal-type domain-containing protein n=1 Tax=Periconia digitata TaxID=1303443 RepID=A0A9W4UAJ0_9PLEO|nr:unnamed protein product [Periconia digitata]